ncbi:hypothetical protein [Nostoc sp. FACHB-110]|uniref:hypothetical protein n=1 Tax=Nostoc sp. FACHB-110 TaxID=2692834 RepID=UPI0018EFF555|nr:hypothetical protein [Nostoc sp. FACHB-110]
MNPIEFKNKWNLSYLELAVILGYKGDRTVREWETNNQLHRYPQPPANVVCHLLDQKWQQHGKNIIIGLSLALNPIEFKNKWQLSYVELAIVLGYTSDRTVRSWGATGQFHRYPAASACVAAYLLDQQWLEHGKKIIPYFWIKEIA